jgi:hypothetical protein
VKLVLVTGPWSSGTSAVAGMLDALGLDGCGPFFRTNDERTRNSFESLAFRQVVDAVASDETLAMTVSHAQALESLKRFRESLEKPADGAAPPEHIFLKYPLSALLIPHISRIFETRLIFVLRPLQDIEATCNRRKWSENFGAKGARVIYSKMFQALIDLPTPTMIVRYPDLQRAPDRFAQGIARFSGLRDVDPQRLQDAAGFVRRNTSG